MLWHIEFSAKEQIPKECELDDSETVFMSNKEGEHKFSVIFSGIEQRLVQELMAVEFIDVREIFFFIRAELIFIHRDLSTKTFD